MADFDMSTRDPLALLPGIYAVEIKKVEERVSHNSGAKMWNVTLFAYEWNTRLCYDNFMLEGNGISMTKGKLKQLGFGETDVVSPSLLVGRRLWVAVAEKEGLDGNVRLEVDIRAHGAKCGYFAAEPAGVKRPDVQALSGDEADPF